MAKILIIEDEKPINQLIRQNLSLAGHTCDQIYDGLEARKVLRSGAVYDLVLLDVMLPHVSGFELVKDAGDRPVIFLTAKNQVEDKVIGLTSGAWDYLTKPFEMLELIARVNLVLKKNHKDVTIFEIGEAKIDLNARRIWLREEEIELTPQEYTLLEVLIRNRNIALSREKLLELAWGFEYMGDTRTVDVHITKLRKKLELDNYIKTVYKTGYRLEITL